MKLANVLMLFIAMSLAACAKSGDDSPKEVVARNLLVNPGDCQGAPAQGASIFGTWRQVESDGEGGTISSVLQIAGGSLVESVTCSSQSGESATANVSTEATITQNSIGILRAVEDRQFSSSGRSACGARLPVAQVPYQLVGACLKVMVGNNSALFVR